MWTSTDSSNFEVLASLSSAKASAGSYSCSRSILAFASRYFLPCLAIYLTSTPMERAVPAMIFAAWSTSWALRSGSFLVAIARIWSCEMVPTFSLCGSPDPFSMPAACLMSTAAGGVLTMKVKERSSKTVITTGTTVPRSLWVWALNALTNSMMFTPCWPRAGPTGGAGDAAPPTACSLIVVRPFFAIAWALDLLDLVEPDLDRRLAAEDRDEHLEAGGVLVDLRDLPGEVRERAGHDLDRLADRELGARARPLGGLAVEQAVDLALRERDGLLRGADEAGHPGRALHERPRVLVEVHVHAHVARHGAALDLHLLAVLHLRDVLGGDDDLAHVALLAERDHAVLEVLLDLVLVP